MATKRRSQKPRRPVHSVKLDGTMSSEHFSPDPDIEELQWAQKFVDALAKQGGPTYTIAGRSPEPGDALLVRGEAEPDVYMQITEAVDLHRVAMTVKRERYTQAMWRAAPGMKETFAGLQVIIQDGGRIGELPEPSTPQAQEFIAYFARCADNTRLENLPLNYITGGSLLREVTTGVEIHVRVQRYAAAGPAQWLWGGPVRILDLAPLPEYVRDVVLAKLRHPQCLKYKGPNPLWLLAFTRDCQYDIDQEREIQAAAAVGPNPFERIYLLELGGPTVRQLYPPGCAHSPEPPAKPKGFMLGSDCLPNALDTRFRNIE